MFWFWIFGLFNYPNLNRLGYFMWRGIKRVSKKFKLAFMLDMQGLKGHSWP